MAGPKKVTKEEYDEIRGNMEKKFNYDKLSDEEKEKFDAMVDEAIVVGDPNEGDQAEKGEFEDGHPHERDDEEDIR